MNVEAKLEALFYFQTLKGKPPIFTLAFPLISANTCSFNTLVIFLTTYLAILLGTTFIPAEVLVNRPSHLPKIYQPNILSDSQMFSAKPFSKI